MINAFSNSDASHELEKLREDAQSLFNETGLLVETDTYKCVHRYLRIMYANVELSCKFKLSIDELSVQTQNFYQDFSKRMDTHKIYVGECQTSRYQMLRIIFGRSSWYVLQPLKYNFINYRFKAGSQR